MTIAFCTLAIHPPYRWRARRLSADLGGEPFVVLTDEPEDFLDLPVRAIHHEPTGPMAVDYLRHREMAPGGGMGACAYHDKRFALMAALADHDTAVFVDADSRFTQPPALVVLPPGLAVRPAEPETIAKHFEHWGGWRRPIFEELAQHLLGDAGAIDNAPWVYETMFAVTKDGHEDRFFEAWNEAAAYLQTREVFTGEGGVIGLAAHCAGMSVHFDALSHLSSIATHSGGGPKAT